MHLHCLMVLKQVVSGLGPETPPFNFSNLKTFDPDGVVGV